MNNIPKMCYQNKIIPKDRFSKNQKSFTEKVERVKLLYVLNEKTINILQENSTDGIIIIQLSLKQKNIPIDIIKQIENDIKHNIIYRIEFDNEYCYGFYDKKLYTTKWNDDLVINYNKHTIDELYKSICLQILNIESNDYENTILKVERMHEVNKKIKELENKKNKEKQLDRKLECRNEIKKLKLQLEKLGEFNGL